MNSLKKLLIILLLSYIPAQTMAWGLLGHRVVGEIADYYLTEHAHKEVQKILGHETLAMSANWADFMKSDPAYNYLYNWHFINFPEGLTENEFRTYLQNDTLTDAYTEINFLVSELKIPDLATNKKVMYLRLLVHLIGDIHQPMHTARKEDLGGSKIQVTWFGSNSNLHRVWDDQLISSQELSYTEYAKAINYLTPNEAKAWQKGTLQDWLYQSYLISGKLYTTTNNGDKLSYKYIYDNLATANDQLLKGGVRLARLLNEIFGN